MAPPDEMKIGLDLKYPLYLRRFTGEERIAIWDSSGTPVANCVNYNHAYEVVRLANSCYKLMNDLSLKPPYANTPILAHDP